ncbi:MAG: c-type cytochrome, partial [bacterium]
MHRQLLIMISIVFFTQTTWAQNGKHDRLDGKYLFETEAGCARCHGIDGKGQTSGLGFDTSILPDFTDCSFNSHEPREEWLEVVAEGGLESGLSDVMPAFGEALTAAQIEAIVDYLKSLCRENGWPQGELNFTRPQTTIKAYPANDAIMNLRYARDQEQPVYSNFVYMRRAGKRSEWDVSVPVMLKSGAAASRGFGDIELRFKHVLHDRVASSSILSGGLGVVLPTGKSAFGTGAG